VRTRVEDASRLPAVLVQLPGGFGRLMGETYNDRTVPVSDVPEHWHAIAHAGVAHVQLVLDPITVESIDAAGEAVREFRNS
jgi:hypothetical protein